MGYTTIMITTNVKSVLNKYKTKKDSYNDVIKELIEEREILSKELLEDWKEAKKEFVKGKTKTLDALIKEEGLNV